MRIMWILFVALYLSPFLFILTSGYRASYLILATTTRRFLKEQDDVSASPRAKISRSSLKSMILAKKAATLVSPVSIPSSNPKDTQDFPTKKISRSSTKATGLEGKGLPDTIEIDGAGEVATKKERNEEASVLSAKRPRRTARSGIKTMNEATEIEKGIELNEVPIAQVPLDDSIDELEALMEEGGKYLSPNTINDERSISTSRSPRQDFDESKRLDQEKIQDLIDLRTNAQKSADFITADKIKAQLDEEYQVEVFDSLGIWKGPRGITGRVASKEDIISTPCKISQEEAQALIDSRTKARRNRDFDLADSIRVELTVAGIEVVDKENKWRSFDGSISGIQSSDFDSFSNKNRNRDRQTRTSKGSW